MNDLIYRQEAIDAIWSHLRNILKKVNFKDSDYDRPVMDTYKMAHQHLAEVIESLPSAEPGIICCEDCKYTDGGKPSADGRYFCLVHGAYMYYCSDAERKEDGIT